MPVLARLTPEIAPRGGPDDLYIQLRAGLATPAVIGRNGGGTKALYAIGILPPTFRPAPRVSCLPLTGSTTSRDSYKYQNKDNGYRLERLRIIQDGHTFEIDRSHYEPALPLSSGHVCSGIAMPPPDTGFDGLKPWQAEVVVAATGADGKAVTVPFFLAGFDYRLPAQYILMPEPPPEPAWVEAWREGRPDEIVLGVALAALTLILALQSVLARHRRVHRWVRNGFLVFTLVWLGWTAGAQL